MATIQSAVKVRESEVNTLAGVVLTANTIHDMIINSGMIQVAADEFIGQAGIFTAKTTAGVGETKVVHAITTGVAGERLLGYKVYRHPTLSFYIKVNYINFVSEIRTSSFVVLTYQIGRSLVDGGFNLSSVSDVFYPQKPSLAMYSATELAPSLNPITVSCGADHFWISRKGGTKVLESSGYAKHSALEADLYSIGVFSSSKAINTLCVVLPQDNTGFSAGAGLVMAQTSHQYEYACLRYHVLSGTIWAQRANGAAGWLVDAKNYATSNGTRVAQAELIINGESHRFNFGFINVFSAQEFGIINVNLTGLDKRYQALPSIGACNPTTDMMPNDMISIAIFPVNS